MRRWMRRVRKASALNSASKKGYLLSDAQAQAILELRLQRLTGLERDKIVTDYRELLERSPT